MSNQMTEEQFRKALPPALRKSVSTEVMDKVNDLLADPDMAEIYRENLLSYQQVLTTGKFKIASYVSAIKYVSQKLMNKTNLAAYAATFPEKMADWSARGVSSKDISSYVHAYSKSKLVTIILEQSMIPTYLLNQDLFQEALNRQAYLMQNAKSEKVQSDAANSIMTQLKRPDTQKIELDVGVKEDSALAGLREVTNQYIAAQREAIRSGSIDAQEAAHEKLVFDHDTDEVSNG